MAWNRCVPYNGIDLSNDTVTAATLLNGITAHDKDGNSIVGTLVVPEPEISGTVTLPTHSSSSYQFTIDTGITDLSHLKIEGYRSFTVGSGSNTYVMNCFYQVIWDSANPTKYTTVYSACRDNSSLQTEGEVGILLNLNTSSDFHFVFMIQNVNNGIITLRHITSNNYDPFQLTWYAS